MIAHGTDLMVGFNPTRLEQMLEACRHVTDVDADALERDIAGGDG